MSTWQKNALDLGSIYKETLVDIMSLNDLFYFLTSSYGSSFSLFFNTIRTKYFGIHAITLSRLYLQSQDESLQKEIESYVHSVMNLTPISPAWLLQLKKETLLDPILALPACPYVCLSCLSF